MLIVTLQTKSSMKLLVDRSVSTDILTVKEDAGTICHLGLDNFYLDGPGYTNWLIVVTETNFQREPSSCSGSGHIRCQLDLFTR